ncbi:hypothetical protein BW723_13745 [Polaribacter reichenbachii]|uniref:Uncharacterized protein n=1 Tax=Polaribacter reichenbachii TaxID=996801 RepID=A0A1B8U1M2_9FLAO|nr:hypothetical protein [Polaribacter reichenbachii]APZ47279.1 hypothetical protein BW723_13745 [Polaribacter reichenbachii]AUC17920.1 hypothetical protein BTO17_04200 [Polaribacter reichenbachii]OBY65755.1 hypothetical protein LPB301_08035 [Polaribacter reichenbachii]
MKNKYPVGCIVTFKSHPLLYDFMIKGDGKLVPPFLVVKEVFIEDNKKKTADELTGKKIAERIKYTCVFFDDNKNEFKEVHIYESMLKSYKDIHIARMDENENHKDFDYVSLIDEAENFTIPNYNYGKIVYFRTKKFEIFKKRSSIKSSRPVLTDSDIKNLSKEQIAEKKVYKKNETIQYVVNYSTPDFVLSGIKKENQENLFYPDGNIRKVVSELLYKVKWFNSNQMKFSEVFLPAECFTDIQPFKTKVPHNSTKKDK